MSNQVKSSTGAIPAVPNLSDAREAARRCVTSLVELHEASLGETSNTDSSPYVAQISAAVENGWQPICRFWPELATAGEALVLDETLSLPDMQFPAPVEAWLLARRTLDFIPGMAQSVLPHQEILLFRTNELLARIDTAEPSLVPPDGVAVALPLNLDSVLRSQGTPNDQSLRLLASDLRTYVAELRLEINRRRDGLSHVRDALELLKRHGETADAEQFSDQLVKLITELVGSARVLDKRLPRPPASVLSFVDRAELAKRIRQYAWTRFALFTAIGSIEDPFEFAGTYSRRRSAADHKTWFGRSLADSLWRPRSIAISAWGWRLSSIARSAWGWCLKSIDRDTMTLGGKFLEYRTMFDRA